MGNLSQLRLLLWKNLLIKRRLPLILFLETAIPLILFLILGWVRHNNPPLITYTQTTQAKALPSTGLITMMQALCSGTVGFPLDGDGLPSLSENSSLYRLLQRVDSVYREFHVLYPNSSLALLDRMPLDYEESLDHLAAVYPLLEKLQNYNFSEYNDDEKVWGMFDNVSSFANVHNFSELISRLNDSSKQINLIDSVFLISRLFNVSSQQSSYNVFPVLNTNFSGGLMPKRDFYLPLNASLPGSPLFAPSAPNNLQDLNHPNIRKALIANYSASLFNVPSPSSDTSSLFDQMMETARSDKNATVFPVDDQRLHAIMTELVTAEIRKKLLASANISDGQQFMTDTLTDLGEFIKFHKTLDELEKLVLHLPLDACQQDDNSLESNSTLPRNDSTTRSHRKSDFGGFYKIFQSLEPVLCPNTNRSSSTSASHHNSSTVLKDAGTLAYGRDVAQYAPVWVKILNSNPKVLFTPANSSASLVMKKANRTFEFVDQITAVARHWLANVTTDLHRYFSQPRTETKLTSLRLVQHYLSSALRKSRRANFTSSLLSEYVDALTPFLEMKIKNSTEVLAQLDLIDKAACSWVRLASTANLSFFVPFNKEYEAIDYSLHKARQDNVTVLAIVAFEVNETDPDLQPHTSYKIRMNSSFLPSVQKIRPIYWSPIPRNWDYFYYFSGFSFLQDIVDRAIIDVHVGHEIIEPGTFATNVPMPCYLYDTFLFITSMVLPLCMTISFVYTAAILVQNIVAEKEHRLKEFMKVMGLSNTVHGLAWFITAFAQLTLSMTIVTLLLRYTQVLLHSNPFIIWLILEFYAVATITFSFLMSSFFSKAKIASAFAGMIYFLSYVPAMCIGIREDISGGDIPASFKQIASLLSTSAFGLSCKYISLRESEGAGVHWNNLATSPIEHDSFSLAHAFVFLAMDSVIYILLAVYVENVHPGSYGIPKPWYFPFTKVYWTGLPDDDDYDTPSIVTFIKRWYQKLANRCRSPNVLTIIEDDQLRTMEAENFNGLTNNAEHSNHKHFEYEPTGLILGVEIDELTKVYKKTGKVAVNGLSLKLYESQITGLLGHNGAGKTSTMSVLTGILPPTSGAIRIYGLDMAKNLDFIRSSVGYCPQHNVLFEQLTPEEHLQFYSGLKSASKSSTGNCDVEQMLRDVGLTAKSSTPVNHLSGGMKRKLSIALAFIGQSRLVILDEPTAGVDPYSRRAIWDLIVKYKAGRTILLSTHHMDEADVLSDRIAVISNGRLKCAGSSIFLRNTFCDGYHLICVKSNKTRRPCDETVAFVTRFLPSAYLYSESKLELHFILPYAEERQGHFPAFFKELDENLAEINVSTYGVYDSTLEEAFLHITRTAQCEEGQTFVQRGHRRQSSDASAASFRATSTTNTRRRQSTGRADDDVPLILRTQGGRGHSRQSSDVSFIETTGNVSTTAAPDAATPSRKPGHARQSSADSIQLASGNVEKTPMPEIPKPQQFDATSLLSAADVFGVFSGGHNQHSRLEEGPSNRQNFHCHQRCIYLKHFRALIVKRLLYVRRNWKVLFAQIFLPAIFVSIAMSMALSAPMMGDPPPLDLSPAQFHNATQPRGLFTPVTNYESMNVDSYHITDETGWTDATATEVAGTLHLISGMSAACTLRSKSFSFSEHPEATTTVDFAKYFEPNCNGAYTVGVSLTDLQSSYIPGNGSLYYPVCHCAVDFSGLLCPSDYVQPPTYQLVTGDRLIDICGQNLTEYMLYTTDAFRRHRYGGIAFGNELDHVPPHFGDGEAADIRRLAVRRVTDYYFEHRGYHSLPAYLNVVNNAILRANIQKQPKLGNPSAYGITTYNHPINGTDKFHDQDLTVQGTDMMIAVFIIIAMSFVPASFVVFLVYERSLLVKHTQMMAGLHPITYWLTNYIWDLVNYFVPAACCVVILMAFDVPAYVAGKNLPAIVLLFVLYGWSVTPMMYPTSFYFSEPSKAYVILVVFNLFIGTTCLITSFLLDNFHMAPVLKTADDILKIVFLVFPSYCLGRGIMDVAINHYRNEFYTLAGQDDDIASPFAWETTLRNYLVMFVEGFLFFGITLILEAISRRDLFAISSLLSRKRRSWVPPSMRDSAGDDPDVVAERHRVLSGATSGDLLVIDGITKQYSAKNGKLLAVDRLSLGLPPGECFGLLGLNGAGKSTTFSMLSGIFSPTAGEARLGSRVLCGDGKPSADVLRSVGYCPQTDPLLDELTAREHLQLYARIRGINAKHEAQVVSWLLERMGLDLYSDKPSRTFSGGTKRKLSAALALLGDPSIVLLDEPTTGMDPGSRRFLWNLILELRSENRLVVLTSHSMEECEVLCSRLGVMVAGKLRCLGSTQQLKDKFGNGYLVTIRLPPCQRGASRSSSSGTQHRPSIELLQEAFNRAGLPSSSWRFIAQRHQIVELALLDPRPNLNIIFTLLHKLRASHTIADFSVSQNTLDSVFLQLAQGSQPSAADNLSAALGRTQSTGNNNSSSSMNANTSNNNIAIVDPATVEWADDEPIEERDDEVLLR